MSTQTMFFLSSVAQDDLTDTRNAVFDELKGLGHSPQMYEKTFGPWTSLADGIRHCLEKVSECHVHILFVAEKAGTYLAEAKKTVTHLELIEAYENKKVIIAFVLKKIKDKYFSEVRGVIWEYVQKYMTEEGRTPPFDRILEYVQALSENPDSKVPSKDYADPYIWVFLYDIVEVKKLFVEDISAAVGINWKDYLSDLLRRGVSILPEVYILKKNAELAQSFGDFSELVFPLLEKLQIKSVSDWRSFLQVMRRGIRGGVIYQDHGGFTRSKIGSIDNCSAVVLFKRDLTVLKVIASAGDTSVKGAFRLDDDESYVALTYKANEEDYFLFYKEEKGIFYLTLRVGEYVISYHFPPVGTWDQQKFLDFNEEIIDGIINAHANSLIFDFGRIILGGVQYEQEA